MGAQPDELRSDVESTRAHLAQNIDRLADRVAPQRVVRRRTDAARNRLTGIKERVMGSAHETGHGAAEAANRIGDTATGAADRVGETAQQAPERIKRQTQGSPLAAGLVAFGAGMLAAAVFPATKAEERIGGQVREHSGEFLEPLKETAQQSAQELKEGLRGPAQESVQAVKSTAQDAARTTQDQARGAGQDTAQQLRGMGQDAAHEVRDRSGGGQGAA